MSLKINKNILKDFSPIVLGSRTRSRKSEPVPAEKGTLEYSGF
jgi:hypothetical protein